jgi:hypothetical protein
VPEILAAANAALAGALTAVAFVDWLHHPRAGWAWIKFAQVCIGAYWCSLYLFVVVQGVSDAAWFGQTIVRPSITITIGVMLVGAVRGWRSRRP